MSDNRNPISAESIEETLDHLPDTMWLSDKRIATLEQVLNEASAAESLAVVNASLDATTNGKDADTRKQEKERAILTDVVVKEARAIVAKARAALEEEKAENKALARRFAAYCHIAELRAAQMILMTKGATR